MAGFRVQPTVKAVQVISIWSRRIARVPHTAVLPGPSMRVFRRGMEGAKRRAEEPAIGARRRAQQPTHRAVESLWERAGPRLFVARRADAGRIAGLE
jgi:hypothetical protein